MKIRINDLARELEVKSKEILDALTSVGVTEKKTHSSSLEEHEAELVRKHLRSRSDAGSGASKPPAPLATAKKKSKRRSICRISPGPATCCVRSRSREKRPNVRQSGRLQSLPLPRRRLKSKLKLLPRLPDRLRPSPLNRPLPPQAGNTRVGCRHAAAIGSRNSTKGSADASGDRDSAIRVGSTATFFIAFRHCSAACGCDSSAAHNFRDWCRRAPASATAGPRHQPARRADSVSSAQAAGFDATSAAHDHAPDWTAAGLQSASTSARHADPSSAGKTRAWPANFPAYSAAGSARSASATSTG